MASADDYAHWIVQNADKKGTPEFETVAHAYKLAKTADTPVPAEDPGQLGAAAIGVGRGFDQLAAGLRDAVPAPIRSGIDYLGDKLGMGAPPTIDPMQQAQNAAAVAPVEQAYPMTTMLAESAPSMAGGPLGQAALAGLSYGTNEERLKNAGGALVGNVLGAGAGKVIARVAQPVRGVVSDAVQNTRALFDKYGISGLPSQVTGSQPLGWIESTLSKLPGGSPIRKAAADQQSALNSATMHAMGAAGDQVTPDAVQAAKSALGQTFQSIPKQTTVQITPDIAQRLTSIESDYGKNLSPDQRKIVGQYLDDIFSYGETGMPGDVYQKARSRISARAASTQDSELKNALGGISSTLDRAFDASAGTDAASAMQTARAQYRAAKTIEPMAQESGNVSPARLANSAKGMPGDLGDLAKLGSNMKSLPDSGTAQRLFYQSLLSGGIGLGAGKASGDPTDAYKYAAGSFALPYVASKFLASDAGRKYLTKGLLSLSPEMEKKLMQASALGGGLLGQQFAR